MLGPQKEKVWCHNKRHNLCHNLPMWRVVAQVVHFVMTLELLPQKMVQPCAITCHVRELGLVKMCPHKAHKHSFTSHNLSCDEL